MRSKAIHNSNPDVAKIFRDLGERIRVARIRRKMRQQDLAIHADLSRSTIQAIEKGELSCSVGALFSVLWTLGLADAINLVADPGLDNTGLAMSLTADGRRVYIPRVVDNDF